MGSYQVFDLLTVAALIDGQVLCVHGGLSPDIRTLDQVQSSPVPLSWLLLTTIVYNVHLTDFSDPPDFL